MTQRLERLLADKERAFWLLQGGGWLAYALLRYLSGQAFGRGLTALLPTLMATATGFCLTLIMASVFRRLMARPGHGTAGWRLWLGGGAVTIACAVVFSVLEIWGHIRFVNPLWRPELWEFLGVALFDLYVLTSWAGLYFGINYYLMVQDQQRRLLELKAEAHAAQLKMLRYQLNPHFLFNTLNSISTLVLMKDSARANAMLGRLADFLRYSLAGEPTTTVSLSQEVQALQLYLDIEALRFQDRLRVRFDIDPDTRSVQLPSLLLQPLVENAIKYAVAPLEDGADVTIAAHAEGEQVVITVADTGPGLPAAGTPRQANPSGVGLANIQDRLRQLYGTDHSFAIQPNLPRGLVVTIRIPRGAPGFVLPAAPQVAAFSAPNAPPARPLSAFPETAL
jgi:hypothetical protein